MENRNPIKVILDHSYEYESMMPDFIREFVGKTGVIVWATKSVWGGYQCSIELDKPHSVFGNFANIVYTDKKMHQDNIIAELINVEQYNTDLFELARFCKRGGFSKYRTKNGDPLTYKELCKQLDNSKPLEI